MLTIDVRDTDLVLAMPHRHGGVAHMLVALEDAGLDVSRIEPLIGEAGIWVIVSAAFTDDRSPDRRSVRRILAVASRADQTGCDDW